MKINPMHSVQAYRKLQETQDRQQNEQTKRSDKVEISSEAKEMAKSKEISAERQERVNEVKSQIEKGTYKVNHQEVAKKFYEFWDR
ncbi:flagellar biosynthesis anti-sigma factor FlgM [Salipaludibacillus daqingensis]|uniref:flagellar biosynthesis anti-sigma factor FlgM n=1 Tax=Salipaludibacillus daqingensis TaxID=3041001 RepID=UPI002476BA9D|nr:flagellar biosynthesis anti-sigma factor FlgM [Salipaludibacillus daqingensis]